MVFKILNGKMPRSLDDLEAALTDVNGQFYSEYDNY